MRVALLSLLIAFASVAGSQETGAGAEATVSPREFIASCIERASGDEFGLDELEESCPGLDHALAESGYAEFIAEDESGALTTYGLIALQDLAEHYREPPSGRSAVDDVAKLAPILDGIAEEQKIDRPLTWSERFRRWLSSVLRRSGAAEDSWLTRWLQDLDVPERAIRMILYISILLIILTAVVIVANEMRAAGMFRRDGRRHGAASAPTDHVFDISHATLADLDRVPPGERPGLLLRILVSTLVRTGRLRAERSLTHRELGTRAAFDAVDQRQSFNRVASLSERILYGKGDVPADEIESIVATGRALDQQLGTPRVAT